MCRPPTASPTSSGRSGRSGPGSSTPASTRCSTWCARVASTVSNHGGQPPTNGARDKLAANDPGGAITKLQAAVSDVIVAESYGAGDLTALKDLIGLIAEGIANDVYQRVRAAFPSPRPGQAKALASVAALIAQGHQQLLAHQYAAACDSFRQAVTKALGIK